MRPQLIQLQAFRSVYSMVSKYIHDPHLGSLFSFHSLLVGGNPFTTTSIYTLIHCLERKWGVFFPKRRNRCTGSSAGQTIPRARGRDPVQFGSERDHDGTKQVAGVITQEGRKKGFDLVISNADVFHTYDVLLKREPRVEVYAQESRRDELQHVFVPDLFRDQTGSTPTCSTIT